MVHLEDRSSKKRKIAQDVAEISRPKRQLKPKFRDENRKPQGRKKTKESRQARYVNWQTPFLWQQIDLAAREVGYSATAIVKRLRGRDADSFSTLRESTVRGWIDKSGTSRCWSSATLARVKQKHDNGHSKEGRRGVLFGHPDVVDNITARLQALRDARAPISVITVRAVMLATIVDLAPEILEHTFK
ncbi:hypothetical protein K435DRAFT_703867, partial [Dendrothele bispora CBS 962.96]